MNEDLEQRVQAAIDDLHDATYKSAAQRQRIADVICDLRSIVTR